MAGYWQVNAEESTVKEQHKRDDASGKNAATIPLGCNHADWPEIQAALSKTRAAGVVGSIRMNLS